MQKERYVLLELTYMTNVTFKASILFFKLSLHHLQLCTFKLKLHS